MSQEYPGILVTHESLIGDFQSRFRVSYPFLMVEFLVAGERTHSMREEKPDPGARLAPALTASHAISISGARTVQELTEELITLTGLNVRICRKCGAVWNEIRLTDGWSLDRQNTAGEYITGIMTEQD